LIFIACVVFFAFSIIAYNKCAYVKKVIDKIIKHLFKQYKIYWYMIVMVPITKYVICKWPQVIRFEGLDTINGNNLLFIFWLVLLALPLLKIKYKDAEIGMGGNPETNKDEIEELSKTVNAIPVISKEKEAATHEKRSDE